MSIESLNGIKQMHEIRLDRFETRKVIFDAGRAIKSNIQVGLYDAVMFEFNWLRNKQEYYSAISREDDKRISAFEKRLVQLKDWIDNPV